MLQIKIDEEVSLRILEERHAEDLFAAVDHCRPYLREWLPWVDATKTVQDSKDYIKFGLKKFADGQGPEFGIWYKGELAGVIGLHFIHWQNKRTSIGYWLSEKFQGKGIMVRANEAMLKYIFEELELNRVEIRVATENKKSEAIPKRLGFEMEGIARKSEIIYGRVVDHMVFAKVRD